MLIFSPVPIIGPIIGGFCAGIVAWRGTLDGLIIGAINGITIGAFYSIFGGGVANLVKSLGGSPQWVNLGFLGTILRCGPIITLLYFGILGTIGGAIGGLITERK
jgi:hypothetical protein